MLSEAFPINSTLKPPQAVSKPKHPRAATQAAKRDWGALAEFVGSGFMVSGAGADQPPR